MDLETENRIAMILMKEAAELRRQADKEGFQAYLRDPKARGRPNSRFLTATVLGVQQANRAVEVNQMWRLQQKEKELDERIKKRMRDEGRRETNHTSSRRYAVETVDHVSCSSSRMSREGFSPRDEGLKDEEIEEFLQARVKRGRGDVGSRMDEPGPYLPSADDQSSPETNFRERWESRILGPEKPSNMDNLERTKPDKSDSKRSKSKHPKKHRSKDKPRDKSKKRKEKKKKRSKHSD